MYLSCYRIAQIRPEVNSIGCCGSCHVDDEELGYDLCAVDSPDGHIGNHSGGVCCSISIYLEKSPLTEEEWKRLEALDTELVRS